MLSEVKLSEASFKGASRNGELTAWIRLLP